jgi:hypothetical protein
VNQQGRYRRIALVVLVATLAEACGSQAEVNTQPTSTEYFTHFLDRPPDAAELRRMPTDARDIVVAKVRLVIGLYRWAPPDVTDRQTAPGRIVETLPQIPARTA